MALVKCPDCGKDISDQALICPSWGRPMLATPDVRRALVQTERTAKKYKRLMMIGILFIIGGCVIRSGIGFIIGLVLTILAAFRAWWHHG